MSKKDNVLQLKEQINKQLATRKYDEIKRLLLSYKDITEHDNDLAMVCYLCTIYEQEKKAGQMTLFSKVRSVDELLERYTRLKFYLRRIEFDIMDDSLDTFHQFLLQSEVSSFELLRVIDFCVVNKDKVLGIIKGGGIGSEPAQKDRETMMRSRNTSNPVGEKSKQEEICFIICTDNELLAEECIYYIDHLVVPEGIEVNVLTVKEAGSMTAGYNEAMRHSSAKYKVYLHQDTFIVNPCFIKDCLEIFRNNPQIGLIGNIGVKTMPASGVMWDADRYGMVYEQHIYETKLLSNAFDSEQGYMEAVAIDGFLMVTQYDISWREDLFTGWDFYDCSQSKEFIRKGYQVVVPSMKEPWCVHDCGFINLANYDIEKEKYIEEYLRDLHHGSEKKISVIIPCYNVEKHIDRCLRSIEDQTCGMNNLEVILVDDVSTDSTLEHLLAFEKKYPDHVLVVSCQENSGPGTARNIGMGYATGAYLAFIDADDKVDGTMFQKMREAMERHDCEVVECGYGLFTDTKEISLERSLQEKVGEDYFLMIGTGRERGRLILNFFRTAVWGRLYRKSFLEENDLCFPDQMKYGEDNFFSGLAMLTCRTYYRIREPLYYYYNNVDGIINSSQDDERLRQLNEVKDLFLREIYRQGLLDGSLDECACEFEWYMIYKYFIDPVRFILSAKTNGWQEQVQYFRREILKLFPEAGRNAYLTNDPKWKEYAQLLEEG